MALPRSVARFRILLMRQVLPPELVAIASGHSGEHRLPVEKTDGDLGSILSVPGPAGLALHAAVGCEFRGIGLPGEGMYFVHVHSSRWLV